MANKRILCIDDEAIVCNLVTSMLNLSGLEVVCVSNTDDALRRIEREQFSLYILDGQLEVGSETTLCDWI
jgi:CheY-like chemotaxis protein